MTITCHGGKCTEDSVTNPRDNVSNVQSPIARDGTSNFQTKISMIFTSHAVILSVRRCIGKRNILMMGFAIRYSKDNTAVAYIKFARPPVIERAGMSWTTMYTAAEMIKYFLIKVFIVTTSVSW